MIPLKMYAEIEKMFTEKRKMYTCGKEKKEPKKRNKVKGSKVNIYIISDDIICPTGSIFY